MKRYLCLIAFFVGFITMNANAAVLILAGIYQGKNVYIQNPPVSESEFCAEEVYVNDVLVMSKITASAFEVDLSHLKMDEPVTVKIVHKEGCKPKVLNPQVLRVNSAFQFNSFIVDERKLTWSTKGEKAGGKMFIEQFLNNNWVVVKEITGHGSITLNNYQIEEMHHSGVNKYRVKFLEHDGPSYYSKVVEYQSSKKPVDFTPKRVTTLVYLSRAVPWEVIDSYGNVIKKGTGKEIDMHSLKEGVYYLNFDNRTEKVLKK